MKKDNGKIEKAITEEVKEKKGAKEELPRSGKINITE